MIFLDKSRIQLFDHTSIKCKAFFRDLALRGKVTRIFVRENGVWLCIHSHFTAVP